MLTQREKEIMELVIEDKSNEEIAKELFISIHTAKAHIKNILLKTKSKTRLGAAVKYLQNKIR